MPYLDRDGVSIYYEQHGPAGAAVPLLLSHGYSASSEMWRPNLAAISAQRRVITWDIRGHGRSGSPEAPDLYSEAISVADMAAVLDAARVERAVIGGLSLGGYLSLAFHLAHPERVVALVLCDTGPGYRRDDAREEWNSMANRRADSFERDGLDALGSSSEVRASRHSSAAGLALAARRILTQHDSRVIESLPHIAVPTLVLVGADDRPFLAAADAMVAKIPGAEKVVLAGAGHAANIDAPQAFDAALESFLSRVAIRPI
ncbi:MAG: alpha/beta fold hydrolase [Acidimicrobiales bacterium]